MRRISRFGGVWARVKRVRPTGRSGGLVVVRTAARSIPHRRRDGRAELTPRGRATMTLAHRWFTRSGWAQLAVDSALGTTGRYRWYREGDPSSPPRCSTVYWATCETRSAIAPGFAIRGIPNTSGRGISSTIGPRSNPMGSSRRAGERGAEVPPLDRDQKSSGSLTPSTSARRRRSSAVADRRPRTMRLSSFSVRPTSLAIWYCRLPVCARHSFNFAFMAIA
jgi:hypothetical protein